MQIEANLAAYLGERRPTARYSSFDYCFNYFQDQRRAGIDGLCDGANLQLSCLHLGFYLASWGMLRGSSVLLRRSARHFVPVVEAIMAAPSVVWDVDADRYSSEEWEVLRAVARQLRAAFPEGASDILVTKIMLGVFGCVPAFDTYFKKGFGTWTFSAKALQRVERFYHEHAAAIDNHRVPTLDFDSGQPTTHRYSRAKVIDMIFFIQGAS
jgi:hypothetical protein